MEGKIRKKCVTLLLRNCKWEYKVHHKKIRPQDSLLNINFRVQVRPVMKKCSSGKNCLSVKEQFSERKLS